MPALGLRLRWVAEPLITKRQVSPGRKDAFAHKSRLNLTDFQKEGEYATRNEHDQSHSGCSSVVDMPCSYEGISIIEDLAV